MSLLFYTDNTHRGIPYREPLMEIHLLGDSLHGESLPGNPHSCPSTESGATGFKGDHTFGLLNHTRLSYTLK